MQFRYAQPPAIQGEYVQGPILEQPPGRPCAALVHTRLQELWLRRPSPPACHPQLLGTPSNVLASGAQEWFPEWHLQYRIARDGLAYNIKAFRSYYGDKLYHPFWDKAAEATEAQKHVALLSVLRSHCDQVRMVKVAAAFRSHTRLDDAIIENIASFVCPRANSEDRPLGCIVKNPWTVGHGHIQERQQEIEKLRRSRLRSCSEETSKRPRIAMPDLS